MPQTNAFSINPIANISDPDTFKIYLERTQQALTIVRGTIDPVTLENTPSNLLFSVVAVDNNPAEHYNLYPSCCIASGCTFEQAVDLCNLFNPVIPEEAI